MFISNDNTQSKFLTPLQFSEGLPSQGAVLPLVTQELHHFQLCHFQPMDSKFVVLGTEGRRVLGLKGLPRTELAAEQVASAQSHCPELSHINATNKLLQGLTVF